MDWHNLHLKLESSNWFEIWILNIIEYRNLKLYHINTSELFDGQIPLSRNRKYQAVVNGQNGSYILSKHYDHLAYFCSNCICISYYSHSLKSVSNVSVALSLNIQFSFAQKLVIQAKRVKVQALWYLKVRSIYQQIEREKGRERQSESVIEFPSTTIKKKERSTHTRIFHFFVSMLNNIT